jgi:3',5'-cyclic AMP phosphodiesterase CpdA
VRVGGLRVIGLHSTLRGEVRGELDDVQLDALADELSRPAADGTVLVIEHPPITSMTQMSDLSTLHEPERLSAVIRGSDVRLVLGGHPRRVSLGTLAGVPVWGSPSSRSDDTPLACSGFDRHAGDGFTRIDIFADGDMVAAFVPLSPRDEVPRDFNFDEW